MAGTNGPKIVITLWLLTIIPFFFMLLRFYCKKRYSRLFGWDDWLLGCSWVLILFYTALIQVSVQYEIGKHFVDADPVQLVTGIKYMYIGELFALVAMPVGKTSFCVTLLRLSTVDYQKYILWFIIITINLTMGAVSVMTFSQCTPVEKLWDLALPGSCWDNRIVIYFSVGVGVYSCIMDFLLAICPYLLIHKLQMNRKEKISIIAAMSIGCLAGVACAVKTAYLPLIGTWSDFTYNIAEVLIWGLTESSITIVAASVPFMRLIFKEISSSAGRSYGMNDMSGRSHGFKEGTHGTKSKITSSEREIYSTKTGRLGVKEDDSSDKSILGESRGLGKIMQTHEVKVEFEESGDDLSQNERSGNKV